MYEDSAGWYDLDYITQDDLDEDSRSRQDDLQDLDEEWYSRRDTQDFYENLTAVLRMNLDENVHIRSYAHDLVERALHIHRISTSSASTHAHILYGSRREHAHVSYVTLDTHI